MNSLNVKFFLQLLILSFLLVGCGAKEESSKGQFKLITSNIAALETSFPGGILIMGRSLDDSQSFILNYKDGLELELKKGAWEFATIGWSAPVAGNLTGVHKCSYKLAELRDDLFTVSFDMTMANCINMKSVDGDHFIQRKLATEDGLQFKKLKIKFCGSVGVGFDSCSTPGTFPLSYRVVLTPELKGVTSPVMSGIVSACHEMSGGVHESEITLPYGGGGKGIVSGKIITYDAAGCTGVVKEQFFNNGFAQLQDFVFNSISYKSMMSPGVLPEFATLNLQYMGSFPDEANFPSVGVEGSLYLYTGASATSMPITVFPNDFTYYKNGNWFSLSSGDVTLITVNGVTVPHFTSAWVTLYIQTF